MAAIDEREQAKRRDTGAPMKDITFGVDVERARSVCPAASGQRSPTIPRCRPSSGPMPSYQITPAADGFRIVVNLIDGRRRISGGFFTAAEGGEWMNDHQGVFTEASSEEVDHAVQSD
jgi:hypothetical protein